VEFRSRLNLRREVEGRARIKNFDFEVDLNLNSKFEILNSRARGSIGGDFLILELVDGSAGLAFGLALLAAFGFRDFLVALGLFTLTLGQ